MVTDSCAVDRTASKLYRSKRTNGDHCRLQPNSDSRVQTPGLILLLEDTQLGRARTSDDARDARMVARFSAPRRWKGLKEATERTLVFGAASIDMLIDFLLLSVLFCRSCRCKMRQDG